MPIIDYKSTLNTDFDNVDVLKKLNQSLGFDSGFNLLETNDYAKNDSERIFRDLNNLFNVQCKVCKHNFVNESSLKSHIKTVHSSKPSGKHNKL